MYISIYAVKGAIMSIAELTKKIKKTNSTRTRAEGIQLLRAANIIDDNGYFSEKYFSEATVAKDRATHKPIIA